MTIHHFNTAQTYDLYEANGNFCIRNEAYKALHAKNDLHLAIWDLIDWIRMTHFTNLSDEDCHTIQKISQSGNPFDKNLLMDVICGRKINRVFYEHAYDLIYHTYIHEKNKSVVLNNEHNFFLYEEIIQLLKFRPLKTKSYFGNSNNR
jgi:hypothetical protein